MTFLLDTNVLMALAFGHKGSHATFDEGLAKAFAGQPPLVSLIK
jgi:predicted nucleic acid-binding protein